MCNQCSSNEEPDNASEKTLLGDIESSSINDDLDISDRKSAMFEIDFDYDNEPPYIFGSYQEQSPYQYSIGYKPPQKYDPDEFYEPIPEFKKAPDHIELQQYYSTQSSTYADEHFFKSIKSQASPTEQ